ncbi:hypothetical protein [Roseateles sp. YR242]|nr:hypothetical protein [Roseateles sp. YR242]
MNFSLSRLGGVIAALAWFIACAGDGHVALPSINDVRVYPRF